MDAARRLKLDQVSAVATSTVAKSNTSSSSGEGIRLSLIPTILCQMEICRQSVLQTFIIKLLVRGQQFPFHQTLCDKLHVNL